MVPNDLPSKVALEAIACATQVDCLVVADVGGYHTWHAHVWCEPYVV